jgi:hypothetical protein
LTSEVETIDLDIVDGEFYWRICRDDLLDPLSHLAASLAPHLGEGAERSDAFSDFQQRMIDRYREHLQQDPDVDDEMLQRRIDFLKAMYRGFEFSRASRHITKQLPRFVWEHVAMGQHLPMRPPIRMDLARGAKRLEIGIFSRECSGEQLEAFVAPPEGYYRHLFEGWNLPPYPQDPHPQDPQDDAHSADSDPFEEDPFEEDPFEENDAVEDEDSVDDDDLTRSSVRIDFALVKEWPLPASTQLRVSQHELPFIMVTLSLPPPPKGILALAYDGIVRAQEQWHLELPGGASKQEKEVAIRTWAVGLLMADGMRAADALGVVATATNRHVVSHVRFGEDRKRLIMRVPEAAAYLYIRARRVKPLTNP